MTHEGDPIEAFIRHPLTWLAGGAASVVTVLASVLGDPIGATAAILGVASDLATPIFTAASISGFTVLPRVSPGVADGVQAVALVFGVIVVVKILGRVWDSLEDRIK